VAKRDWDALRVGRIFDSGGGMNLRKPRRVATVTEQSSVVNFMVHPRRGTKRLPRSRWRRAWYALRGWHLYGP